MWIYSRSEVTFNRALENAFGSDRKRPTTVRLRGLKPIVLISGEFREHPAAELRRTVPVGWFQAHCLGRVENWNSGTNRLTVRPIAIFS